MEPTWTDIVSAVGQMLTVVISLVGFYYVGKQIKQANLNLKQSNHTAIYSINTEIYKFFAEHSDLRPYFHEGKLLRKDDPDRNRVFSLSELMADFFEFILVEKDALAKEIEAPWEVYMRKIYRKSGAFRLFIHENKDQYSEKLLRVFSAIDFDVYDDGIEVKPITNEQDLLRLDAIYQEAFGESSVPTARQLEWWRQAPGRVIGLAEGATIAGGLSYWPVRKSLYKQFLNGELKEREISASDLEQGSGYYYLSDIVISEGLQGRLLSNLLLKCMLSGISKEAAGRYPIRILALAFSRAGLRQLQKMGFTKVREASEMPDGQELFQLEIDSWAALSAARTRLL